MEEAAYQLQSSVQTADNKLDIIAFKLEQYEKIVFEEDPNEVSVLTLLESVNQVKEEYETLRREISEVQQLQKQLSDSLKTELKQVQGRFGSLRQQIIKTGFIQKSEDIGPNK